MVAKLTQEEFVSRATDVHGGRYDYSKSDYKSSQVKVVITCHQHGDFEMRPNDHLSGKGCRKCADARHAERNRLTQEEFISRARKVHGDKYSYDIVEYKGRKTKVIIGCPVHGMFHQTPDNHLAGYGCNACGYDATSKKNTRSQEHFETAARKVHGNKYDYSKADYRHGKSPVEIICPKHGSFWQRPNGHVDSGHGCPQCSSGNTSRAESDIVKMLEDIGVAGWQTNVRDVIAPYELDIYNEDCGVAVELNGEYWHTERSGKDKKYHENKRAMCEEKGILLMQFGWQEWIRKRDIVISMIAAKCGHVDRKEYARKCEVRDVPRDDALAFCEENHLKGWAGASVRKGLYKDGELLAIATFAKPRFDRHHDLECIRLCTKLNTHIVGAAGRLFGSLPRDLTVLSYADKRYGIGKVYQAIGMKRLDDTPCGYVWVSSNGMQIVPRYKSQKHKLGKWLTEFDPNVSEVINMENAGFSRMWDCGHATYSSKQ